MLKKFGLSAILSILIYITGCSEAALPYSSSEPVEMSSTSSLETSSSEAFVSSSQASSLEASSSSTIAAVPQADEALVHDILVNFGAEENDDGTLIPQPVSLYYTESLDADSLTQKDVFSWYISYMQNENLTQDEKEERYKNPLGDGMGWFFPAEYYEPLTMSYFGVDEEFLHDEFYYNEEYDGYTIGGGGGMGHRPEITLVDWTQNDDILTIELLFPEMHRKNTEMLLTVKLLQGDLHSFISYLPSS